MQKTGIEYLTHTWNPIAMRCTGVSPGCDSCWHLRTADRLAANEALPLDERKALIGDGPFILRERELSTPLSARKPAVIGVQFMGDLFHEAVPDEFIVQAYASMWTSGWEWWTTSNKSCTPHGPGHTFLVLTKRPGRMIAVLTLGEFWERVAEAAGNDCRDVMPVPFIYHGLTICNQQEADEKIPFFLRVPGKKFLSIEPMLGAVDLGHIECQGWAECLMGAPHFPEGIDAVILGGETGPGARPMHPDWVRSIRDQCAAAGVPFFFKGWGKWGLNWLTDPQNDFRVIPGSEWMDKGIKHPGRLLDGRTHDDLPWEGCGEK